MENFSSFQQFFKESTPPVQLFDKGKNQLTPKSATRQVYQNSKEGSAYSSLRDTKRKSSSVLKKAPDQFVKIYARFRPFNQQEMEQPSLPYSFIDDQTVVVQGSVFTFDNIFNPEVPQATVYQTVANQTVQDAINGTNGTVIAYGQTGSGKTHTMLGTQLQQGIIYRAVKGILPFQNGINISLLEVYKESINDLLSGSKDLKLKEDTMQGVYVEHLSRVGIETEEQLYELIAFAEENRHVAETKFNIQSSRSHLILIINLQKSESKLNLVDLAGSEKVAKTGAKGDTLEEAKKINFSLSCLGHVVQSLAQALDHIPYRDSKLTRLLQDSLKGNCRTSLIVTCSPDLSSVDETVSSLKFAQRTKLIKSQIKQVESKKSYKDLENEIANLKNELQQTRSQSAIMTPLQIPQKINSNNSTYIEMSRDKEEFKSYLQFSETPPLPDSKNMKIPKQGYSFEQFKESNPKIVDQNQYSIIQICNELQLKISYFLKDFSNFMVRFNTLVEAKPLSEQVLSLSQLFQQLFKLIKGEDQQNQPKIFQKSSQSQNSLLSYVSLTVDKQTRQEENKGTKKFPDVLQQVQEQLKTYDSEYQFNIKQSQMDEKDKQSRTDEILKIVNQSQQRNQLLPNNYRSPVPQNHFILKTEESDTLMNFKHNQYQTGPLIQKENVNPSTQSKRSTSRKQERMVYQPQLQTASSKYLKSSEQHMQQLLSKFKKG